MATAKPRGRKTAAADQSRTVKASLLCDVETHARWSAAASLRGMTNNAFALEALKEALRGLVIIDRRKSGGRVESDSPVDRADAA